MPDRHNLPDQAYQDELWEALDDRNYFRFYRRFLLKVPIIEAVFVQHLVNYRGMRAHKTKNKDGWFRVSLKDLQTSMGWAPNVQARLFHAMDVLGWVSTKRTGIPARRWVFVHLDKIVRDLKEAVQIMRAKGLDHPL